MVDVQIETVDKFIDMVEIMDMSFSYKPVLLAKMVNNELLLAYWNIGKIVIEYEQAGAKNAEYGKQLLKMLSKILSVYDADGDYASI